MPEPKIDPDLSFVATAGGDPDAYVSPALQQRFDALAAENAGLREALEAARPVVEAAVAWRRHMGESETYGPFHDLAAAVDSYAQSSNPAPKEMPDHA